MNESKTPHGNGNAFGVNRRTLTVLSEDGHEIRSDEFVDPYERTVVPSSLWDPKFDLFICDYPALVMDALIPWHESLRGAQGMIVNHATNDLLILLDAIGNGDGRTAARTARAMFEHLVHYKEISVSSAKAAQYADHVHVTADQISRTRIGLRRLDRKTKSQETRRLEELSRRAKEPLRVALSNYGESFYRGWTAGDSVYKMATRYDLEASYESYRILSGVMHGSAGALLGTRREKAGAVTHRLGMDLQLAPLAFHEGVSWWRALLDELPETPIHPDWGIGLREATDTLLDGYPEIFGACRRLDNRLWPVGRVAPKRMAVLALYPGDTVRWYLYDIPARLLRPANLVGDPPTYMDEVVKGLRPLVGTAGGRPATATMMGVQVEAIQGRRPIPEEQLLVPSDMFGARD